MAIPSTSGTEVLKRNSVKSDGAAWTAIDWQDSQTDPGNDGNITVPTGHIFIIMGWTVLNTDAQRHFHVKITNSGHDDDIYLCEGVTLLQQEIFTWNDTIILHHLDTFNFYASGANLNLYISYLDQNWS